MSVTERIVRALMSSDNTLRLISETALKDLKERNPLLLLQDLQQIISLPSTLEIKELSYLIIRSLLLIDSFWDSLSSSKKSDLFFQISSEICTSITACLTLSSLILAELNQGQNSNLNYLLLIPNNSPLFRGAIRTLGHILEANPPGLSIYISSILQFLNRGLIKSEIKICALQAYRRGMHCFSENYTQNTNIGVILYNSCRDKECDCRAECLETIIEYTQEFCGCAYYIDVELILFILQNDVDICKILAIEVLCTGKYIDDLRIIDAIIPLLCEESLNCSCVDYLSNAFYNERVVNYAIKYINLTGGDTFTAISLIGCIPAESLLAEYYLETIINVLSNSSGKILEISAWALSQIVSQRFPRSKVNETVTILLDLIFPSMIYNQSLNFLRIYCCWTLKEIVKTGLNYRQTEHLLEKLIVIDGNAEEIYAGWTVVSELIDISTPKYISHTFFEKILKLLIKENNEYRLECLYSTICKCLVIINDQGPISEKYADQIVLKLRKLPNDSPEKLLLLKMLKVNLMGRFDKYMLFFPFLVDD